jgi:lactate dehydrogenase-like 2-hydroxyacid dehydrogenase
MSSIASSAPRPVVSDARVKLVVGLTQIKAVDRVLGSGVLALELVVATSMGFGHEDLEACQRRGLPGTNGGDVFIANSANIIVGLSVTRQSTGAEAYGWKIR